MPSRPMLGSWEAIKDSLLVCSLRFPFEYPGLETINLVSKGILEFPPKCALVLFFEKMTTVLMCFRP